MPPFGRQLQNLFLPRRQTQSIFAAVVIFVFFCGTPGVSLGGLMGRKRNARQELVHLERDADGRGRLDGLPFEGGRTIAPLPDGLQRRLNQPSVTANGL